jgi:hypothetical protein
MILPPESIEAAPLGAEAIGTYANCDTIRNDKMLQACGPNLCKSLATDESVNAGGLGGGRLMRRF